MELHHILRDTAGNGNCLSASDRCSDKSLPPISSILATPGSLVAQLARARNLVPSSSSNPRQLVPLLSPTIHEAKPAPHCKASVSEGENQFKALYSGKSRKIPVIGTITVSQLQVDSTCMFSCPTCGRKFKRKSDLVRHKRIHTGERPNSCYICNKKFIQRSALRVHLRVHTGEKPYSCSVCQRQFSDSSSLARHRKMHLRDNTQVVISQFMQMPCLTQPPALMFAQPRNTV